MTSEPTDLIPLYEASRSFDSVMRGYDRAQVDREFGRLDDDLRVTAAERDAASARSADLAAQLGSANAQIESLRRQLRTATDTVTSDNVDDRVRQILLAARVDAAKLRAEAETEAHDVRDAAAQAAERTLAEAKTAAEQILARADTRLTEAERAYAAKMAEADAHRAQVEAALAESERTTRATEQQLTDAASAERARLDAEASGERERLDAEALARRNRVDDDFEITMRVRRTKAHAKQTEQRAAADEYADTTRAEARAQAAAMIDEARAEVERLNGIRETTHSELDALHGRLRASLDEARSAASAQPELSTTQRHPLPGPGETLSETS